MIYRNTGGRKKRWMNKVKARKWEGTYRSRRSQRVLEVQPNTPPSPRPPPPPRRCEAGGVRTWGGLLCVRTVPSQVCRAGENPNINPGGSVLRPLAARVAVRRGGEGRVGAEKLCYAKLVSSVAHPFLFHPHLGGDGGNAHGWPEPATYVDWISHGKNFSQDKFNLTQRECKFTSQSSHTFI